MTIPEQAKSLQVEIAEQIARDASCSQGEFNQRVLSIIPYLTDVCDRASLVGVERALPPLRAREEIAQEVAKIVDEPLGDGALAACDYMGDEAADDLRKAITRALSSTAGQEWRVPEGWQLVEQKLLREVSDALGGSDTWHGSELVARLNAALPAPPVAEKQTP